MPQRMLFQRTLILGCGDIGQRIAALLLQADVAPETIVTSSRSGREIKPFAALELDLDLPPNKLDLCDKAQIYYLVPPQREGQQDKRVGVLLQQMQHGGISPKKVVLISTTGVYGDRDGDWVTENSSLNPTSGRALRRLDAQRQWLRWGEDNQIPVVVLRVPGIYSNSRLPRKRLEAATPVVRAQECGYSNRIHADDLSQVCVAAMRLANGGEVFNVSDGVPGSISEYLQVAAQELGFDALEEISLEKAKKVLSAPMLSYLSESRRIDNSKMMRVLNVELRYPDFREGVKYG